MKPTTSKLAFGFNAVVAGQRKVVDTPELVALTTNGGFRISRPVSKALDVQHGEYIQFIQNVDQVQKAINDKATVYVEFCAANGLDADSTDAAVAFHKENDMWGIVKGYALYNDKGTSQTCTDRLTKADREAYAAKNYDEILAQAQESGSDELKDAIAACGDNKEEIIKVLATVVRGEEKQKYSGSKVANTSEMLGAGVVLNFTDSNVWNILKNGMGEDAAKKARKFPIDLDAMTTITLFNGYENIEVPCLPFDASEYEDVDAARSRDAE
jgi:hypothetical protein